MMNDHSRRWRSGRRWFSSRMTAVAAVALSTLLACASAAVAAQPNIDLNQFANVRLDGAAAGANTGSDIAAAGDVNGDGRPDFLIGSWKTNYAGRVDAGAVHLVLGSQTVASLDLGAPS